MKLARAAVGWKKHVFYRVLHFTNTGFIFQANEHGTHGLSGNPLSLPHPTHLNIPSSNASNNLLVLSNLLEGQPRLSLGDKDKEAATASLMSVCSAC